MMDELLNMSINELEKELSKYNLVNKDLELFKSGKDFIDKAWELNNQTSPQAKNALLVYCIYKIKGGK